MEGYPASNPGIYNGQLSNSIGPIKFESEPYHSDMSNNNGTNYAYEGTAMYGGQNAYQAGYQYNQGTMQADAQGLYGNQTGGQPIQHVGVNGNSFNTPKTQAHMPKMQNSGGDHNCDICDKVFSSSASMRRHREIHTGIKKFSCELCGNSYTQKHNLTKHMRLHTGEKPYKCHICEKAFYIHHHLKNHMMQHSGELPYNCPKCSKRFKYKFRFDRHLLSHEESANTDGSVAQTPPSVITSEENSMSDVWKNGIGDDENDDDMCEASMYDSFDEESKYDEHECEVCQQIFINKESLDNHFKLQHAVDREFKCDECSSIFLTRAHLVRHRRTHTGEQIYECDECNVSFRWKVSLHIHMRRHNNDYKKFECSMCNKYFLAKESLKKHMNMHLGTLTYECDECEEKFTSKNEYKEHLLTHGEGSENDKTQTSTPKSTSKAPPGSGTKLPPTCKTCLKTFSSNSSLRKHEFTHMDVKPHKCLICNVSFAQRIQLRLHNKKHNGGVMEPASAYRKKEEESKANLKKIKKEKEDSDVEAEKDDGDDEDENDDDGSDVSSSRRRSPVKTSSPSKVSPISRVSPVRIKIDKSKIIPEQRDKSKVVPERRNAPRKARNVIKESEEEVEEESSEDEGSETEVETSPESSGKKKSRWEGYRYPVCEHCHKVFKKRKALERHQKSCKRRE